MQTDPAVPPVEEGTVNPLGRMVEVLTAPSETMRSIAARPNFLVAMIIITVISVLTTWLITPRIDFAPEMRAQLERQNVPPAQIEKQLGAMEKVQAFIMPVMAAFSPLFLVIAAGVLLLGFRMMGGEGSFHQAISITTYSWMPYMLKGIVMTALVLMGDVITPSMIATVVPTNLGFLVSPMENPALFALLTSLDLVTIWVLVLSGIGFSYASKLSRGRSIAIVLVLWLVWVAIKTVPALLQG